MINKNNFVKFIEFQNSKLGKSRYKLAAQNILKHTKEPKSILDLGSANGYESLRFLKKGADVHLVDKYFKFNDVINGVRFTKADVETLKLSKKYDLVLIHNTLAYLKNPSQLLRNIKENISNNGYLSIVNVDHLSDYHLGIDSVPRSNETLPYRISSGILGRSINRIPLDYMISLLDENEGKIKGLYRINDIPSIEPKKCFRFYQLIISFP